MSEAKAIEILKQALILERQGQSFYRAEAEQAEHESVADIFHTMADEEQKHEQALISEYRHFFKEGHFQHLDVMDENGDLFDHVISEDVQEDIRAASHEAAAISAAIGLEHRTVDLYTRRAANAEDPEEKELYTKLADWERGHVKFLSELNRRILQEAFFDGVE